MASAIWHLTFEGFTTVLKSYVIFCTIKYFVYSGIWYLPFGVLVVLFCLLLDQIHLFKSWILVQFSSKLHFFLFILCYFSFFGRISYFEWFVYLNHSVLVVYIHSSDLVVFLTRVRLVFVSLGFSFYLIRVICSLWSLECHSPPKSPEYDIDRPKKNGKGLGALLWT